MTVTIMTTHSVHILKCHFKHCFLDIIARHWSTQLSYFMYLSSPYSVLSKSRDPVPSAREVTCCSFSEWSLLNVIVIMKLLFLRCRLLSIKKKKKKMLPFLYISNIWKPSWWNMVELLHSQKWGDHWGGTHSKCTYMCF